MKLVVNDSDEIPCTSSDADFSKHFAKGNDFIEYYRTKTESLRFGRASSTTWNVLYNKDAENQTWSVTECLASEDAIRLLNRFRQMEPDWQKDYEWESLFAEPSKVIVACGIILVLLVLVAGIYNIFRSILK